MERNGQMLSTEKKKQKNFKAKRKKLIWCSKSKRFLKKPCNMESKV